MDCGYHALPKVAVQDKTATNHKKTNRYALRPKTERPDVSLTFYYLIGQQRAQSILAKRIKSRESQGFNTKFNQSFYHLSQSILINPIPVTSFSPFIYGLLLTLKR